MDILEKRIKDHEGFRDRVYLDSENKPTCGWGHNLWVGSKVPAECCELFFKQDLTEAMRNYTTIAPALRHKLNTTRARVIIEMIFNMNVSKVLMFRKMWEAIEDEDWSLAADEMLNSKWATQVGNRAITLANILEKGVDPNETKT